MNNCLYCEKQVAAYLNYCNGDCHIADAKRNGAVEIRPNGLPITCIGENLLECEDGDHPTYLFPVRVEYIGVDPDDNSAIELHALIYTDGNIALTMYECCYNLFFLCNGKRLLGKFNIDYRLTADSIAKIEKHWLAKSV